MGLASGSTFGPDTHLILESKASRNLELADWLDCLTNEFLSPQAPRQQVYPSGSSRVTSRILAGHCINTALYAVLSCISNVLFVTYSCSELW